MKYIYQFAYQNSEGDTTAHGILNMTPLDEAWEADKSQKKIHYKISYDYLDTASFYPTANGVEIDWRTEVTTGYSENETSVWIHPFRKSIFYITEIAPSPRFNKSNSISSVKSTLKIGGGWGTFIGKNKTTYQEASLVRHCSDNLGTIDCKVVIENPKHKLGWSNTSFLVSNKNDFVSISYKFFNGDSLDLLFFDVMENE